jgi:hypothetical protein
MLVVALAGGCLMNEEKLLVINWGCDRGTLG